MFAIIFFSISLNAFSAQGWKTFAYESLPESLKFIQIKKTALVEVEKRIGKAQLIKANKQYYEIEGFKYSLEVIYKNNVVQEISYSFNRNRPAIDLLKFKDGTLGSDASLSNSQRLHLKYVDKEVELVIDPVDRTLSSVRFKE